VKKEKKTDKIEKWAKQILKDDYDKFDLKSEVDPNLSIEENKAILLEKFKDLGFSIEITKQQVKHEQEMRDKEIIEELQDIEEQAEQQFQESLTNIKTKQNGIVDKAFATLTEFTKMVVSGHSMGLIVEGETGIGKSYNILKVLKQENCKFVYCGGYTTPLELYHFLYHNRDKVIFFDDTKNIFGTTIGLELLKSCMFSATGTRIVRYSTTSNKLKVPNQFIFTGGLIVSVNELENKQSEDIKAIIDRVLYHELKFNYFERIHILAELSKLPYKDLKQQERDYIFDYIKQNTDLSTTNLNFRLLFKLYEMYLYDKSKFDMLANIVISKDIEKELVIQVLKDSNSIKEAQVKWCEETGKSRRTFFRLKKQVSKIEMTLKVPLGLALNKEANIDTMEVVEPN